MLPPNPVILHRANYPLVWLVTAEPHRAEREWALLLSEAGIPAYHWDICSGGPIDLTQRGQVLSRTTDPVDIIGVFLGLRDPGVLFLWNFHRIIDNLEVIQTILNSIANLQASSKMLVILAPEIKIPVELEKVMVVTEFTLPSLEQLREYVQTFAQARNIRLEPDEANKLARAGLGLTKFEFMAALALSVAQHGRLDIQAVWDQKAQLIRKNPVLELYQPGPEDRFEMLGGLDNAKAFLKATVGHPLAKGVLILGVPGTGKSALAKALGGETGLPVIILDFGRVFGSLVGESEARLRAALAVIEAMAPCIVFIDEIEKALGGVASSHLTDGGTVARVVGRFLTWLNDRPKDICVIATCNDIDKLPSELSRAERWDCLFFSDLPTPEERLVIWRIWLKYYGLPDDAPLPPDDGWTGAEIKTCCRLAAMMGISPAEAAQFIVPIAQAQAEKIAHLREWASQRCVPASKYSRPEGGWATFV